MIVLDANILIRAVLGKRVRLLIETYTTLGVRFYAPAIAYADAERYLPALMNKRGKPDTDVPAALAYLQFLVEPLAEDGYSLFEAEARERLRARDEEDWPVLAAALSFFGIGVPVWSTERVEIFLKQQSNTRELKDE